MAADGSSRYGVTEELLIVNRTRLRGMAAVAAAVATGGLVFGAAASGSFVSAGPVAAEPMAGRSGSGLALAVEDTRAELRVSWEGEPLAAEERSAAFDADRKSVV